MEAPGQHSVVEAHPTLVISDRRPGLGGRGLGEGSGGGVWGRGVWGRGKGVWE